MTASVRCKHDSKVYALKKTSLKKSTAENKKRANNELKIHRILQHPFIVQFKEGFVEKDSLSLVMDLCEGGDLYRVIQHQRKTGKYLSEDQIMTWFVQLLLGVDYLHRQNIVHTDLKTANVFFTKDYRVQLGGTNFKTLRSSGLTFLRFWNGMFWHFT